MLISLQPDVKFWIFKRSCRRCTLYVDFCFRLPGHIKRLLCQILDPPNVRGNDWRMLAQRLSVDRWVTQVSFSKFIVTFQGTGNMNSRKQQSQCSDSHFDKDYMYYFWNSRYINYFATKPSPTEHILDLWEARHREDSAITDLMNSLRVMGRMDAAGAIEKEAGSWL